MNLRSTRLEIRAQNKALNEAARKAYETAHRETGVDTAQTFKGQFDSRYTALNRIINPSTCTMCGEHH